MKKLLTPAGALTVTVGLLFGLTNTARAEDLLVKLASPVSATATVRMMKASGAQAETILDNWIHVKGNSVRSAQFKGFFESASVIHVQPNFKIKLLENYKVSDPLQLAVLKKLAAKKLAEDGGDKAAAITDNPDILPAPAAGTVGPDPMLSKQWGMNDIGIEQALKFSTGKKMIVAVIDTGVAYNHEDLLPNLWRNEKEIPNNGIDDDGNGFIDDAIGWDFVSNDNKPWDLYTDPMQMLFGGGNPGHGTHCAGNVAAVGNNSMGITGVAPEAKIMSLRFISEKGEGTTEAAMKAIKYAVDNGAQVLSNSWGSEGEDPAEGESNQALRDIIQYAQDHNVLFVAAAGNGHSGVGYDNDTDKAPAYPASYDHDTIISVAALDSSDKLGSFSNWGAKTVDIGAPGVKVFSSTADGKYNDMVIDFMGFSASWDGTSMAAPHVAGAAALYWSLHPEKTYKEVKEALLASAKRIPSTEGKMVSNGKLNLEALIK